MSATRRSRLRVLFALPHVARGGGAERIMLTLLRHIDRDSFEPRLLVLDAARNESADVIPADVPLIDLGVSRVRYAGRPLLRVLRQTRPDVLVSGLGHLNLMVAMMRPLMPKGLGVIGRETAVVTAFNAGFRTSSLRNLAYRWFYSRLDQVVCQSEDMRDDLTGPLAFPADRIRLIPNPVDVAGIRAQATLAVRSSTGDQRLRLVAVGRLAPQKGFDLLVDAIAELPRGSCRLDIIGEGPLRASLAAQIARLGLQESITLVGFQENPYPLMRRADALVLSSRYEGLPNVVLESLACGTPVIGTPCPGGIREIARRVGGVTIAASVSAPALAAAIDRFARGRHLPPTIDLSDYRLESVVRQYEDLIRQVAAQMAARP